MTFVDPTRQSKATPDSVLVDDFTPPVEDRREKDLRRVVIRPGQGTFRDVLCSHYGSRCCISGCNLLDALEAAHITSYRGDPSDHVRNGLLLRADLHTLYDRYLLSIDPESMEVVLADLIRANETYRQFHGHQLFEDSPQPARAALQVHWSMFAEAEQSRQQASNQNI